MMFADDPLFYIEKGDKGIYKMFRKNKTIQGCVRKPTGKKDKELCFNGKYKIEWQTIKGNLKYFIIKVRK